MGALHDLVKSGKVRYLGASSIWTYQFAILQHTAEKHGFTKFIAMQNHYNLLYREEEREMIRFCNLTGVGLIPVSKTCRQDIGRLFHNMSLVGTVGWGPACAPTRTERTDSAISC
jgi:aryl-alcohol dehydrogenase-like predicted oxidoreductase